MRRVDRYISAWTLLPLDCSKVRDEIDRHLLNNVERDHFNTRTQKKADTTYPSGFWLIDEPHRKPEFSYLSHFCNKLPWPVVDTKIGRLVSNQKIPAHVDTFHGIKILIPIQVPYPGTCFFNIHDPVNLDSVVWDKISLQEAPIRASYSIYEGLPFYFHGTEAHSASAPIKADRRILQIYIDETVSLEQFELDLRTMEQEN